LYRNIQPSLINFSFLNSTLFAELHVLLHRLQIYTLNFISCQWATELKLHISSWYVFSRTLYKCWCMRLVVVACLAAPVVCAVCYAGVRAALLNDRYTVRYATSLSSVRSSQWQVHCTLCHIVVQCPLFSMTGTLYVMSHRCPVSALLNDRYTVR